MTAELATSIINLRVLGAAVAFASKEETRYYLNGVCLEIDARDVPEWARGGNHEQADIEDAA